MAFYSVGDENAFEEIAASELVEDLVSNTPLLYGSHMERSDAKAARTTISCRARSPKVFVLR